MMIFVAILCDCYPVYVIMFKCNFCLELLCLILCVGHHQHSPPDHQSSDDHLDFEQTKHQAQTRQNQIYSILD